MANGSAIPPQMIAAYEAAEYRVEVDPTIHLRIGQANEALARLMTDKSMTTAAFLTACNPHGQMLAAADNATRTAALGAELERFAPLVLPACGVDPAGRWPDEPGFLALGCPPAIIEALGRRHRQNAVVLCGEDAVPRLVLLR
ncbi:MAG: DUF3293 domain-containing protein [Azoarcus sp.]|nr:DUF3293 domain-containing protein [Azoarcus sp.]